MHARIGKPRARSARRPGQQRQRGFLARHRRRHHTAIGLRDQQHAGKPGIVQPAGELVEIAAELRPDIGIQHGGAEPVIEADRREQIGRDGQIRRRQRPPHQRRRRAFLRGIGEGVHEADRHRLDPLAGEQLDRRLHIIERQRREFAPVAVDAPADAQAQIPLHQRRHVGVAVVVLLLPHPAPHLQRIAQPRRGDQPAARAGMGERGIGRDRGAVHDGVDAAHIRGQRQRHRALRGDLVQPRQHRDGRVLRRAEDFVDARRRARLGHEEIGEGAADIDADLGAHGSAQCDSAVGQTSRRISAFTSLPMPLRGSRSANTTARGCL